MTHFQTSGEVAQPSNKIRFCSSFFFLNVAQFIGAMNDNIFKLLLVYFLISIHGTSSSTTILSMAGAIYVLPFLIFSTTGGILADQYSKSRIIFGTRIAELIILLFGILAFSLQSTILSFSTLFLLATHSAIFGPCKYGIIPEIVKSEDISKANGALTSCSYIAIIAGTFLASFLTDITHKNFIASLALCCSFSCIAIVASFRIQKTEPAGSTKRVSPKLFSDLLENIRIIKEEPSLLNAVFGSAFFLFVGSFLQLNMIPYAIKILHISDVQGGYIFLLSAVGIGVGSIVAGKISGKFIEFGLVPFAGFNMAICCFLLDFYSGSISSVIALAFLFGFFGGMYVVPLDSFIQVASPKTHRGQIVATVNLLSFFFVLLSAISLYIIGDILHLPPDAGFTIIGICTLLNALVLTISMYGYLVRFISFLMSTLMFPKYLQGRDKVPLDKPSLFLVPQSMWPWVTVLLASQRKCMRIFTIFDHSSPPFPTLLRRFVYVSNAENVMQLLPGGKCADIIRHSFERGTSIAIFCSKKTVSEQGKELCQKWAIEMEEKAVSFFQVSVPEEGQKTTKEALCAQIELITL